jgi:predicted ATP-grasp superfamily ATP-dependent carboligase
LPAIAERTTSTGVLVTDGEQRSALAVVRSLARAGHRVSVAARGPRSLAGASRGATARIVAPDPLADPNGFVEVIAAYAAAHDIGVVIPTTEAAALAVLGERDRLPAIPMSDLADFRALSDKAALREHAATHGIAFPPQCEARDAGEARRMDLQYPIVLKPARSVGEWNGERVKLGVRHASNREQLERHLSELPPAAYPLLLQRRIVGPGVGVFLLMWDGVPIATFMHRRIREKPPSGGVSVYAESIAPDVELITRAARLLHGFGWQGVAMVELKIDASSGTPYLMEINGRLWGSLQLAIDAGVDFPALLVERALGRAARGPDVWRVGVRGRWWWGDVDHLVARLRHADATLALPPDAPPRGRALLEFARTFAPDQVFRLGDPAPFLLESARWLMRSA